MSLFSDVPMFNDFGFNTMTNWNPSSTGTMTRNFPSQNLGTNFRWSMDLDVIDTDKEYLVMAELPGVCKEKLDVGIENNFLIIKAEKNLSGCQLPENKSFVINEIPCGLSTRRVALPMNVDQEQIKTCFQNGVLCIKLPKKEGMLAAKKLEIMEK